MFFKVLRYDLLNGTLKSAKKYLLAILIFIIAALDFTLRAPGLRRNLNAEVSTVGDYLMYLFYGMNEYEIGSPEPFRFPALWMLVVLFALYIVLYYPYNDLYGYGKQVLVNAGSRSAWWLSKCAWVVSTVLIYFLLLFSTIFIYAKAEGTSMSLNISKYMYMTFLPAAELKETLPTNLNAEIILMPFLLVLALGLLQLFMSLLVRPILSYSLSIALLVISAYYVHPCFLGNYAMIARSDKLIETGVNNTVGIYYLLGIIVISIILGWIYFYKFDILSNERI
jgi:hypothetical protein